MVGERDDITVEAFAWYYGPEGNVAHLAAHDVTVEDVYSVLAGRPLYYRNLPGRRATHVMIGRDQRRRSLFVTLLATAEPGEWLPVTGWRSAVAHRILAQEGRT